MTNKITEALKLAEGALGNSQQHLDLHLPKWVDVRQKNDKVLAAIREALAEPQITTPDVCGEVCARAKLCYGCGKALDEANAKLAESYACEAGECPDKSLCAGACECLFKAEPVKPSQLADASLEPVAWALMHKNGLEFNSGYGMCKTLQQAEDMQRRHLGALKVVPLYTTPPSVEAAVLAERERLCSAIKAEDDYCVDNGDYMLDSDDCIAIVRGIWKRPDYAIGDKDAAIRARGEK